MIVFHAFIICLFVVCAVQGLQYGRCGFARALNRLGVSQGNTLDTYVCIATAESSLNTDAVGPPNSDGSTDYGIFQLNNRYWCDDGHFPSSNGCHVSCQNLLGESGVTLSLQCADTVRREGGGWNAWTTYYKCVNPQSNADCFKNSDTFTFVFNIFRNRENA